MRLLVLGSGTLYPDAQRASAGIAVMVDGQLFVFDLGRGVVQRMDEFGIDALGIEQLHLTHFHPDHCCDLAPLLFAMNYGPEPPRSAALHLSGPVGLNEFYEGLCAPWPWIRAKFPLELAERGAESWQAGGVKLQSFPLSHGERPSLGYRLQAGGRSLAYTGDTGPCDALLSLASQVDILVSECSFPDGRARANHMSPLPLARAAAAAGVRTLVVTHVYPGSSGGEREEILKSLKSNFEGEVLMAHDGLSVEF